MSFDDLIDELKQLRDAAEQEDALSGGEDDWDATAMAPWRQRIDVIDRMLVTLLNERSKSANAIGHIKQQLGMPIYVPEREKDVLNNVIQHGDGPLEDAAVRRLFERIIDETRSLERRKYQK